MLFIGISGKQGTGKSTLAKTLMYSLQEQDYKVRLQSLAAPIKEIMVLLEDAPNPFDAVEKYYIKHLGVNARKSRAIASALVTLYDKYPSRYGVKNRKMLQYIGTEFGRTMFGEDAWVRECEKRAIKSGAEVCIVDDVRFPNELAIIDYHIHINHNLNYDEYLIRCDELGYAVNDTHASEACVFDNPQLEIAPYRNPQPAINAVLEFINIMYGV